MKTIFIPTLSSTSECVNLEHEYYAYDDNHPESAKQLALLMVRCVPTLYTEAFCHELLSHRSYLRNM